MGLLLPLLNGNPLQAYPLLLFLIICLAHTIFLPISFLLILPIYLLPFLPIDFRPVLRSLFKSLHDPGYPRNLEYFLCIRCLTRIVTLTIIF